MKYILYDKTCYKFYLGPINPVKINVNYFSYSNDKYTKLSLIDILNLIKILRINTFQCNFQIRTEEDA